MRYVIEKLELTDVNGASTWPDGSMPVPHGDAEGSDARDVLTAVVSNAGHVPLVATSFRDDQALVVARSGRRLYALRAYLAREGTFTNWIT